MIDQPNIPGTVNEHPNWRQRLPVAIDEMPSAIDVAALKAATAERARAARLTRNHSSGDEPLCPAGSKTMD